MCVLIIDSAIILIMFAMECGMGHELKPIVGAWEFAVSRIFEGIVNLSRDCID